MRPIARFMEFLLECLILIIYEPNEDLSVELVDKNEAKRILREENLSVKAYYLLLHFIQSDPSDPFAFLKLD